MSLDLTLYANENDTEELYTTNITHNLNKTAKEAGMYKELWRPEEIKSPVQAKDIIAAIEKGLIDVVLRPTHYKQFDAPNGWGKYEHFVPWVSEYLEKLKEYPEAYIHASR